MGGATLSGGSIQDGAHTQSALLLLLASVTGTGGGMERELAPLAHMDRMDI